jgi:ribokinase
MIFFHSFLGHDYNCILTLSSPISPRIFISIEKNMSRPIVVVGSLNMDLVVRAERHPQPGETLLGSNFGTFPGGKGANQAVAAARLGGTVRLVGRVGTDSFGDSLLANLARDDVDTSYVRRTEHCASGVALITLDAAGQNTIVVAPGANALLSPQDIIEATPAFQGAAAVLVQLEIPLATVATAVDLANRCGVPVILNPAPAQTISREVLMKVDYLIPNQSELALLTGINNVDLAADAVVGLVHQAVIVTLGGDGVLVAHKGERAERLPAHPVTVVDTVAAGDAFVGAFAVALAEGKDTRLATIFGNAAGALAVTRSGAQPSLPTRQEVDQFLGYIHQTTGAV